jgi:arylsulfatase A-like enzyme
MRHLLLFVATITAFSASLAHAAERPNIIFFLSDDHRADVLGCAGHPIVKTPSIDKLAANGVRYENAFVTTSICAASRATLFTGLFERTHGYTFGKPPIAAAHSADSYPAQLKDAGYRTGFVGKFGVKVTGGRPAIDKMFDSYVPIGRGQKGNGKSKQHFTDIAGDKALAFISSNPEDKPFCLSVSFNAAHAEDGDKANHYPHPATESKLYDGLKMPRPEMDGGKYFESQPKFLQDSMNRDRYYWRWDTPEKFDRNMRHYFRMLTAMDRNIGRVMDELKKRGIADNTVILFMGDNGYYMGERGFAGKWSHYEQSLRVPLIVQDPRATNATGVVKNEFALNLDIAATILNLAGIDLPKRYQGRPLVPSDQIEKRDGFFCEHRMQNNRIPKWEGFRGNRYVYANYYEQESDAEFLHDLKEDPNQLTNLATDPKHQRTLEEMRALTNRLSKQYLNEK